MNAVISDAIQWGAAAVGIVGTVVGAPLVNNWLARRREKTARTPHLAFEFSDLSEHENLGAVGFRNLQSKLELLISGTIKNRGALATDIKLDIYHFISSKAHPVHEISRIRVCDALEKGESRQWIKKIGLSDLTVDGDYYKSGPNGIFSERANGDYYPFHVVFSCKNQDGEEFSTVYFMNMLVENNRFKSNEMVFFRNAEKYKPLAKFPVWWRDE